MNTEIRSVYPESYLDREYQFDNLSINQIKFNMAKYYVNTQAQANGDHEVHKEDCRWLPSGSNKEYLGEYASCHGAITEAKRRHYKANGCYYCCRECHTS